VNTPQATYVGAINLIFNIPRTFSTADFLKLERATGVYLIEPNTSSRRFGFHLL